MQKTALITGSSRGIGKAIALKFAKEDYNVVLNCKTNERLMFELADELKNINKNVMPIKCDVSIYKDVKLMFEQIRGNFGDVDVLINNAAVSYIGLFDEMLECDWRKLIDVNLNSVINCCHVAIPSMINKKSGSIINISSIWGNSGASCEVVYSATKGAVNSFTKALAKELAPCGITINAVACGVINTEMNDFLTVEEKEELTQKIPMGRFGLCSEVADVVYFLACENASYLTGQIIGVDGGY